MNPRAGLAVVSIAIASIAATTSARADGADGGSGVKALELEIDRDDVASQNADCAIACRALDAMMRAADRLCALDPGDACERAREKVRRAEERVRAACPDCAKVHREERAATPPPAPVTEAHEGPPSEPSKRGGCAACSIGEPADSRGAALALLFGLAGILRSARAKGRR